MKTYYSNYLTMNLGTNVKYEVYYVFSCETDSETNGQDWDLDRLRVKLLVNGSEIAVEEKDCDAELWEWLIEQAQGDHDEGNSHQTPF